MTKKWKTPLEKLMEAEGGVIETVEERTAKLVEEKNFQVTQDGKNIKASSSPLPSSPKTHKQDQIIIEVDPFKISNWEFHDRPETELGDIESLAKDISENGQAQPCIVRPYTKNNDFEYELIVGERRWRATKLKNIRLKVLVQNLSDAQAAIYQIAENGNRKDLSDYAKGMNYASLIEKQIITSTDLQKILNKTKSEVSRLLSFNTIPKEIWAAIGDTTKISARTSAEIRSIINKGEEYLSAVIKLSPKLRSGKIGARSLLREVEELISGKSKDFSDSKIEIKTSSGRHLFSWRKDTNGNISISFPKDVRIAFNKELIEKLLANELEKQLSEIDKRKM